MTNIPAGSTAHIQFDQISIQDMQRLLPELLRGRPLLDLGGNGDATRKTSCTRPIREARDNEVNFIREHMNNQGRLTANEQVTFRIPQAEDVNLAPPPYKS